MKRNKTKNLTPKQKPEAEYVFQNNTKGNLMLPGIKMLKIAEQFEGSAYYLQFVPTLLSNVKKLDKDVLLQENTMDKLITEQPPHINKDGKVEFVKSDDSKKQQYNEKTKTIEENVDVDVLLNETGCGSIEII